MATAEALPVESIFDRLARLYELAGLDHDRLERELFMESFLKGFMKEGI